MLNVPWWLWGCLALFLVGTFFVIESRHAEAPALARYGHTAVWLLLAAACFTAHRPPIAKRLAASAGLTYVVFMAQLVFKGR